MLVEAPAPSPGEQYLFWYAALWSTATRSKITDDGKKRSLPNRAAISHLLQTGQPANLCNFHRGYQKELHKIPVPILFEFLLPDAVHRKHLRCQRGSNLSSIPGHLPRFALLLLPIAKDFRHRRSGHMLSRSKAITVINIPAFQFRQAVHAGIQQQILPLVQIHLFKGP